MVSNFGMGLMGLVDAYPAIQQQGMDRQMNQLKLQQAQQQWQQQQAARTAYQDAINKLSQQPGQGPGGVPTLQQMAAMSGGNPDVMQGLSTMTRPYINPYASLERANITGDTARDVAGIKGEYGIQRQGMQGEQAQQRVDTQQAGAKERAQMASDRIQQRSQMLHSGKNLTYDSATRVYHETEIDMRTLKNQYLRASEFDPRVSPMDYVKDPQWKDLATQRQQALDIMQKKEKEGDTAPAQTSEAATPVASIPPEAASQLKEGQITTFGNGQQWTLQGGQPVQVK